MWTRRIASALVCAVFALCIGFPAPAEDKPRSPAAAQRRKIEWQAVEGARRYEVKIRDAEKKIVLESYSEIPHLEAALPPGVYEIKITVMNVFDKPAVASDWMEFRIVRTGLPEVSDFGPKVFYRGTGKNTMKLSGSMFMEETKVFLAGSGRSYPLGVEDVEDASMTVSFDPASLAPGSYDLVLENPSDYRKTVPGAVSVRERTLPIPEVLSLREGTNDRVYALSVRGRGFEKDCGISFETADGKVLKPSVVEVLSGDAIAFSLNLAEKAPGPYDLVIENPGGLKGILKSALLVKDALREPLAGIRIGPLPSDRPEGVLAPSVRRAEAKAEPAARQEVPAPPSPPPAEPRPSAPPAASSAAAERKPEAAAKPEPPAPPRSVEDRSQPRPEGALYATLGWSPCLVMKEDYSKQFGDFSLIGASLAVGFEFGAFFPEIPVLRNLGFELCGQYARFQGETSDTVTSSGLDVITAGTSLTFRTRFDFPLNLTARLGYGFAFSFVKKSSPLATFEENSTDSCFQAGAGLRWDFDRRFFAEAGADWTGTLYVGSTFYALRPFLKFGVVLD